jgi:hypothetical protein
VAARAEPKESPEGREGERIESRNAEAILAEFFRPQDWSWRLLEEIACLTERTRAESHPNRDGLVSAALAKLESAKTFSRCIEFHEIRLISRLYTNLTESERWRLLGAITAIVGEMRKDLHCDPNWVFMVAFSAVDLTCRARAETNCGDFGTRVFQQLLEMHWKWHGVRAPASPLPVCSGGSTWSDASRRMLLALTRTDACETLYMAMAGLRFFAELFPDQIPAICREGLAEVSSREPILALAQLWATRHPEALKPVLHEFEEREKTGPFEQRLDA